MWFLGRVGLVVFLVAAGGRPVFAQDPPVERVPPPPPEPAVRPEGVAGGAPVSGDAEQVAALERRIAALEAQRHAAPAPTPTPTPTPFPLSLSGYLQPRYEWHQDANYGVDAKTRAPRESSRFLIRRARLAAFYRAKPLETYLQIGSTGEDFGLLDAEVTFIDVWTPLGLRLTMGQFVIPFGFEILQRSVDREMPERALMVRAMFPSLRDRGLRLQGGYGPVRFVGALVNGNGIDDPIYRTFDETSWKDLVGRLSIALPVISGGVSGYYGHTLRTVLPADVTAKPTYARADRVRVGADLQLTLQGAPASGPLRLRAEVIWSNDTALSFSNVPGNPCNDVEALGWYVELLQSLGARAAIFGRVDDYNPRRGVPLGCPARATSGKDRTTTLGGGAQVFVTARLKATAAYEHLIEQGPNRGNDVFTAQAQAVF